MQSNHQGVYISAVAVGKLDQRPTILALAVFLVSFTVYVLTLAPGLLWGGGDFATFQARAYLLEIEPGIFGHPLWVALTHPFTQLPIRDVAWRANFATAVYGALALVFIFLTSWHLTHSAKAALLGTGALMVSHTFWTYSVMPKVYSLNALLLAMCIYLLIRWGRERQGRYLYAFSLLYAISQLNHLVMATAAAGFALYIAWKLKKWPDSAKRKQLLTAALVFLLGLVPYLGFTLRSGATQATGTTIVGFLRGMSYALTAPRALVFGLGIGFVLLVYQFPVTGLVGLIGLRELWNRERATASLLLLVVVADVAFLLGATDPRTGGHYVWNLHYYLQAYTGFAIWISVGFERTWSRWTGQSRIFPLVAILLTLVLPIIVYAVAPIAARPFLSNLPGFRPLPGRDNLTYVLSPWKHREAGARDYGQSILSSLPPNSILFADYSIWAVVRYLHVVEAIRPDIQLIQLPYAGQGEQLPLILQHRDEPYLFLADLFEPYYDTEEIKGYFDIVPAGSIYWLVPKG